MFSSRDVTGDTPEELALVVKEAGKILGVESEDILRTLGRLEERLVRFSRLKMGEGVEDEEGEEEGDEEEDEEDDRGEEDQRVDLDFETGFEGLGFGSFI